MLETIVPILAFITAIASGLVAGIFFAFSNFIMAGLGRLAPVHGAAAMRSINITVINPLFLLLLLGTGLPAAAVILLSLGQWQSLGGILLIAASVIYIVGTIWVTMAKNVPLNNALDRVQPGSEAEATLWSRYLRDWTMWNTVRTIAPALTATLLTLALLLR